MTGYTVAQYDRFFQTNYDVLEKEACRYNTEGDLLHDVYMKVRQKVTGITITYKMMDYFKKALKNGYLNSIRYKKTFVEIAEGHVNDDFTNNQEYYNQIELYKKFIISFVQQRYNEKQQHVYFSYYIIHSGDSFQQIAKRTGYSLATCKKIAGVINLDIRKNFDGWVKTEIIKESRKWKSKNILFQ